MRIAEDVMPESEKVILGQHRKVKSKGAAEAQLSSRALANRRDATNAEENNANGRRGAFGVRPAYRRFSNGCTKPKAAASCSHSKRFAKKPRDLPTTLAMTER